MKTKIDLKECSLEVFEYFLDDHFKDGKVLLGRNIPNPFLSYKQKTPSFNILQAPDGNHIYHDFATGDTGNCVSFVARLKGVDRIKAIQIIRKITK